MKGNGVEQDYEMAIHLYKQAAEQGYIGAKIDLGNLYRYGIGVEQDYEKAQHYFQLAAKAFSTYTEHMLSGGTR
jgi:TPR repeat protein